MGHLPSFFFSNMCFFFPPGKGERQREIEISFRRKSLKTYWRLGDGWREVERGKSNRKEQLKQGQSIITFHPEVANLSPAPPHTPLPTRPLLSLPLSPLSQKSHSFSTSSSTNSLRGSEFPCGGTWHNVQHTHLQN